ncbi:MAG: hypothetical protein OXQ94_18545 [Gemmatimonadota bacterium]|nr:hypothetical protein [Gemmatimonadota bacterium]
MKTFAIAACVAVAGAVAGATRTGDADPAPAEADGPPREAAQEPMTFFVTSVGPGDGANLGGLEGADAHCETLAAAQEAGGRGWRAYLSTINEDGSAAVNARDRIGSGPWHNQVGKLIASDIDELHSEAANLDKEMILTEMGDTVNGRGDNPNMHDILTGSDLDGTAFTSRGYDNCGNWTGNGEGMARVGHHDRLGGGQHPTSWNSAHFSRGCGQEDLRGTGGSGLFYCFAAGG